MKLLFLDTETSGVDCNKDQIIEIGAVILELENYELKLVDYFQTTVALRKVLDERITRITGITEGELASAPALVKAQNLYNAWIEKYENQIAGIVGHSIDFDIGFLKKEGWFLPTKNYYDTLNLAKIMLPNMQAINLEFLSKKIGFGENLKGIPNEGLSYHRALYDAIMSANLFEHIIKQVNSLECSQAFVDQLCNLFLPEAISFYKSEKLDVPKVLTTSSGEPAQSWSSADNNTVENNQNIVSISHFGTGSFATLKMTNSLEQSSNQTSQLEFTGQPKTVGINQKIKQLAYSNKLEDTLKWTLPTEYKMIVLQLYVIAIWNSFKDSKHYLKLHSLGIGFWVANFVLELLIQKSKDLKYILINPENIIDQINRIADQSINFKTIATYLEILDKILKTNNVADQNVVNWLSQYEFFLVTLQPLMTNYDHKINFINPLPAEKNVATKFLKLIQSLRELQLPSLKNLDSYDLLHALETKIIDFVAQLEFEPSQVYTFKLTGNKHLFASCPDPDFDLNFHFERILKSNEIEQVQTYLSQDDYEDLLDLAKINTLDNLPTTFNDNYDYRSKDNLSRLDFLNQHIELAKEHNQSVFIVCGQNSSLKNLTKTASDYDLMQDVLVIGESGGITKIASKVDQGFVGVVIFKFSNLDYFLQAHKIPNLAKIALYDRPYFFINDYWYKHSKTNTEYSPDNYLKILKDLFLQAKVNYFYKYFKCEIELFYNLF
jgi:DNA polymerase III epsilon subunit-like protein